MVKQERARQTLACLLPMSCCYTLFPDPNEFRGRRHIDTPPHGTVEHATPFCETAAHTHVQRKDRLAAIVAQDDSSADI